MKLAIAIPTINRKDLLLESLRDLAQNFSTIDNILIVDNGKQKIIKADLPPVFREKTWTQPTEKNLGVAGS